LWFSFTQGVALGLAYFAPSGQVIYRCNGFRLTPMRFRGNDRKDAFQQPAETPQLHNSITPPLHHFITPSLHQSNNPSLHRSNKKAG
jgi:hypothetical protein